jgi:hypothetical protein
MTYRLDSRQIDSAPVPRFEAQIAAIDGIGDAGVRAAGRLGRARTGRALAHLGNCRVAACAGSIGVGIRGRVPTAPANDDDPEGPLSEEKPMGWLMGLKLANHVVDLIEKMQEAS